MNKAALLCSVLSLSVNDRNMQRNVWVDHMLK